MTVLDGERDLSPIEDEIVSTIEKTPGARPSTVIPAIETRHPGADVRGAYWRLVKKNIVHRELNGLLVVTVER